MSVVAPSVQQAHAADRFAREIAAFLEVESVLAAADGQPVGPIP